MTTERTMWIGFLITMGVTLVLLVAAIILLHFDRMDATDGSLFLSLLSIGWVLYRRKYYR